MVEVPILDDTVGEPEEMFYGSLSTPSGANVLITQDSAQIRIIDDDGMLAYNVSTLFTNHFYISECVVSTINIYGP